MLSHEERLERIRTRTREYRKANKDRKRKYDLEYYEANKEARLEYQHEYNKANKGPIRVYNKANKGRLREYHREYNREYYQGNKERITDARRKYRARKKVMWVEDVSRRTVWERDNKRCQGCDKTVTLEEMHLDHIIPLSRTELEPEHSYANTQCLCGPCNTSKGDKTMEEWLTCHR